MTQKETTLLIIGAGPAGYTAAIYAARAGLKPILYEGPQTGGQLMVTTIVENYPGYPSGVLGTKMMEDFREQALRFGAIIRSGTVTAVNFAQNPFSVTIDHQHQLQAHAIIIATGSSPKWLGLKSEQRLIGRGVSSCATCDGFFYKDQEVAVVGGGDSAAEEALHLAKLCRKVYMIIRRNVMRASFIMQQRIQATPTIHPLWHTETQEVLGNQAVEGVLLRNNQTGQTTKKPLQGLFIAIGHRPNTTFLADALDLDDHGYIRTIPGTSQTSRKGIFAAGDVQDPIYRQAVTAAASGCMAALDAERFLMQQTLPTPNLS